MKLIKKLITIAIVICCMYVTAKWPGKVVSITEFGYNVTKLIVVTVKDSISSGASKNGPSDALSIENGEITSLSH